MTSNGARTTAAAPQWLRGPDFVLSEVAESRVEANGAMHLRLADGSAWTIVPAEAAFAGVRAIVDLAARTKRPVFIAGNRQAGTIERALLPQRLSPLSVGRQAVDGVVEVEFHTFMSRCYLKTDRIWFETARALLEATSREGGPPTAPPALLVTIDIVTQEVVDVRRP